MATKKKAQKKSKEVQIMENLCQQNDINLRTFKAEAANVDTLEMLFGGYPELIGLRYFTSLTFLRIIGQDLSNVSSLKYIAPTLAELWICECKIEKLDGLEKCTKLKVLYLYDNCIENCAQLAQLTDLEILWLNSNKIGNIQCIQNMPFLKNVNFACNQVTDKDISELLSWPPCLENANFSQNDIREMKSLIRLTSCKNLISCSFADSAYKPCPLTMNQYYASWICYHFRGIQNLDGKCIKNARIASILVETLKLRIDIELRKLDNQFLGSREKIDRTFAELHSTLNQHVQYLAQLLIVVQNEKINIFDEKNAELLRLKERIEYWMETFTSLHLFRSSLVQSLRWFTELNKHWLRNCLENCEYYSTVSSLLPKLVDSMISHFCARQMNTVGYTRIQLLRFVQFATLNETLQSNEQLCFALYDNCEEPKKIHFNQLYSEIGKIYKDYWFAPNFFVVLKQLFKSNSNICTLIVAKTVGEEDQSEAVETGEKETVKKTSAKVKSTSVTCDKEVHKIYHRLNHFRLLNKEQLIGVALVEAISSTNQFSTENLIGDVRSVFLDEQINIDARYLDEISTIKCKTFVESRSKVDSLKVTELAVSFSNLEDVGFINEFKNLKSLDISLNKLKSLKSLKNCSKLVSMNAKYNLLVSWYDELNSLRFSCPNLKDLDLKFNLWSSDEDQRAAVFAKQFLCNLETYNSAPTDEINIPLDLDKDVANLPNAFWNVAQLSSHMSCSNWTDRITRVGCVSMTTEQLNSENWKNAVTGLNLVDQNLTSVQIIEPFRSLHYLTLSGNPLIEISSLSSLQTLQLLHLDRCYIERLPSLRHVENLVELSLSENRLESVDFCKTVPSLSKLDISSNKISSISEIQFLTHLTQLILCRNKISSIQEVKYLKAFQNLDKLEVLDLTDNSVQQLANYKNCCIQTLSKLRVLDYSLLTDEERKFTDETFGRTLSLDFLQSKFEMDHLKQMTHLSLMQLGLQFVNLPLQTAACLSQVTSVNLSGNKLKHVGDLVNLEGLEVLDLTDNSLTKMFPNDAQKEEENQQQTFLPNLKKLILPQNNISKLEFFQLSCLPSLIELILKSNKLTTLLGLEDLVNLQVLDVSFNKISNISSKSLKSLANLKTLLISNNKLKDLSHLNLLLKLERLDVSYNCIQSFNSLREIESLKRLNALKCTGNSICKRNFYRNYVVAHLPQLNELDGKGLSETDKDARNSILLDSRVESHVQNMSLDAGDEEQEPSHSEAKSKVSIVQQPHMHMLKLSLANTSLLGKKDPKAVSLFNIYKPRHVDALNFATQKTKMNTAENKMHITGRAVSLERRSFKR